MDQKCFFLHLLPLFSHPHIRLKFQICPSVKKDKNRKFVLLSTHSENEGVWCLVLVGGDSGACSGNRGGGAVAVVGGLHCARILRL